MESSNQHSDNTGPIAFRSVALVVTLLLLFTPFWPLAIVFFAFSTLVFVLRFACVANRTIGVLLITLVGLGSSCYLFLQFSASHQYQRLLTELSKYEDVTIRRELFPIPRIPQLSIGNGVTDAELSAILELKGLAAISELYLDNNDLTDASLNMVASKLNLNYIFIDCNKVTDTAILEFEKRFPDCTVIPYKRGLHDDGVDVYLGAPPNGE